MKTLSQIIDEVKDGQKPDYDDLRYALVTMCALQHFSFNSLMELARREREGKYNPKLFGLQWHVEERFNGYKKALNMPPKEYCGPSHDPDTEEAQKWRRISKGILKQVIENQEGQNT